MSKKLIIFSFFILGIASISIEATTLAAAPNESVTRTKLYDSFTLKNIGDNGQVQRHLIAVRGTDVSLVENCGSSGVRTTNEGLEQLQPINIPNSISIYAFDAEAQQFFRIQNKTKLQRGRGYFITSNDPIVCLTFAGDEARESTGNYLSLYPGWNLIAAPTSKIAETGVAAGRAVSIYSIGEHAERTGSVLGTDPLISSYLSPNASLYDPKRGYISSLSFFTNQFFPGGWPIGEGAFVYAKKRIDAQFDQISVELTSKGL